MSNNVVIIRNTATRDVFLEIYRVIDQIAKNHPEIADKLYYTKEEEKELNFISEE